MRWLIQNMPPWRGSSPGWSGEINGPGPVISPSPDPPAVRTPSCFCCYMVCWSEKLQSEWSSWQPPLMVTPHDLVFFFFFFKGRMKAISSSRLNLLLFFDVKSESQRRDFSPGDHNGAYSSWDAYLDRQTCLRRNTHTFKEFKKKKRTVVLCPKSHNYCRSFYWWPPGKVFLWSYWLLTFPH